MLSKAPLLQVKGLYAEIEGNEILKGLDLTINAGEIHAIMGPNGSGKSTLSKIIIGHPDYEVTAGEVLFCGENILEMDMDERAHLGVFLGFQYPVEIPGVNNIDFLELAYTAKLKATGKLGEKESISREEFMKIIKEKMQLIDLDSDIFMSRSVNEGFSGGEKKRNEILQMAVLDPALTILDEIDSGLDIDALKAVAHGVNKIMSQDKALLLITHYQRLLNYITPTHVHIMANGRILESGDHQLALSVEQNGYETFLQKV